ncbi:N-acyl homoserine lactonase family protein [Demequina capsici]|uniref:N-acyl homoserine lactonase family protein n=1 Tax=Demequina capsici TaxID=3075620 RepID=A0AA96FBR7_9MICO|nr:N-acyl homoserine lactonase family protein [Demequina sp. PMTSA13]WNM26440.1 N-acyl homoserine lactonase family protein [Demequina sp. PMTSA13]
MGMLFPEIDVVALNCGRVRVRPKNIRGTGTPMLWWTLTARTWSQWLPVHAFLVSHPQGTLLFDTGQSPASLAPGYYPRGLVGWVFRRQAEFQVEAEHGLTAQLTAAGSSIAEVDLVAVSHLHQDHAGNVALFGESPVLLSRAEHDLLSEKDPSLHGVLVDHVGAANYRPVDFPPPADPDLAMFEGAHDVFGDGALVLVPTPGHTSGSMSLLVRRAGAAPLLLVGDLTYDPALLEDGIVPDVGDRRAQREASRRVRELIEALPGLVVLAAHDPEAEARLTSA